MQNSNSIDSQLTIVGVGPGDPSYITLAAIQAIKDATLIAYPIAKKGMNSIAAAIVKDLILNKEQLPLYFPLDNNTQTGKESWDFCCELLVEKINQGENLIQTSKHKYLTSVVSFNK